MLTSHAPKARLTHRPRRPRLWEAQPQMREIDKAVVDHIILLAASRSELPYVSHAAIEERLHDRPPLAISSYLHQDDAERERTTLSPRV